MNEWCPVKAGDMSERTVRELMIPLNQYALVSQEATLKTALRTLHEARTRLSAERHRPRALLVVNDEEKVVGKLEHLDILRALEPKYGLMGDLNMLSRAGVSDQVVHSLLDNLKLWEGTLDDMCCRAAGLKVRDLMRPVSDSIDSRAPIIEVIHRLLLGQTMRLLVTEGDKVVGVLRLADVVADVSVRIESAKE